MTWALPIWPPQRGDPYFRAGIISFVDFLRGCDGYSSSVFDLSKVLNRSALYSARLGEANGAQRVIYIFDFPIVVCPILAGHWIFPIQPNSQEKMIAAVMVLFLLLFLIKFDPQARTSISWDRVLGV